MVEVDIQPQPLVPKFMHTHRHTQLHFAHPHEHTHTTCIHTYTYTGKREGVLEEFKLSVVVRVAPKLSSSFKRKKKKRRPIETNKSICYFLIDGDGLGSHCVPANALSALHTGLEDLVGRYHVTPPLLYK